MHKIYILSPHIDDAIFSLGGKIYEWDSMFEIIIINIFSKTSFVNGFEENEKEAMLVRKNEEKHVEKKLKNTKFIYLDFPEALLRWIERKNIFSSLWTKEITLSEKILQTINEKIHDSNDIIYVPAWFWNHIDHLIVRDSIFWTKFHIRYYADLPYYGRNLRQENALLFLANKRRYLFKVEDWLIEKHIKLSSEYKSQILDRHMIEMESMLKKEWYIFWE